MFSWRCTSSSNGREAWQQIRSEWIFIGPFKSIELGQFAPAENLRTEELCLDFDVKLLCSLPTEAVTISAHTRVTGGEIHVLSCVTAYKPNGLLHSINIQT